MTETPPDPTARYDEWLERVRTTHESVGFTCLHRLHDRALAGHVATHVVAGMLARPGVFRYFGLPYSGRIAHLAEERIGAARTERPSGPAAGWAGIREELGRVPDAERTVFVLAFVDGAGPDAIAAELGISAADAAELRERVSRRLREVAALIAPGADEPDLPR